MVFCHSSLSCLIQVVWLGIQSREEINGKGRYIYGPPVSCQEESSTNTCLSVSFLEAMILTPLLCLAHPFPSSHTYTKIPIVSKRAFKEGAIELENAKKLFYMWGEGSKHATAWVSIVEDRNKCSQVFRRPLCKKEFPFISLMFQKWESTGMGEIFSLTESKWVVRTRGSSGREQGSWSLGSLKFSEGT